MISPSAPLSEATKQIYNLVSGKSCRKFMGGSFHSLSCACPLQQAWCKSAAQVAASGSSGGGQPWLQPPSGGVTGGAHEGRH